MSGSRAKGLKTCDYTGQTIFRLLLNETTAAEMNKINSLHFTHFFTSIICLQHGQFIFCQLFIRLLPFVSLEGRTPNSALTEVKHICNGNANEHLLTNFNV